jgi:hypothetical protein
MVRAMMLVVVAAVAGLRQADAQIVGAVLVTARLEIGVSVSF